MSRMWSRQLKAIYLALLVTLAECSYILVQLGGSHIESHNPRVAKAQRSSQTEIPATKLSCVSSGSLKPRLVLFISAIVLIVTLCRLLVEDNKAAVRAVANCNAKFLTKIFPVLVGARGQESNLVMSSFSVISILALAYSGAQGNTRDRMQKLLSFPSDEELKQGYQAVFSVLNSSDGFTLYVANHIFVHDRFHLLDKFIKESKTYFSVEPHMVDFGKSEEARQEINTWVKGKTHDKIKDLIHGGVLNDLTNVILVNAVYFKGIWAVQFNKNHTRSTKFPVSPTETVDVNMMSITGEYKLFVSKELGFTILQMPYKGDRLSMLFILSMKDDNFEEMEKKFSTIDLSFISATRKVIYVEIPRFKVETTHLLVQPLKDLGLVEMFNKTKADFSGMSGNRDLYLSEAIQKAFIEVNEEGSEAGAATGMNIMEKQSAGMIPRFICDRPFLFAIKDDLTWMVLFIGRVIDPTKS